MKAYIKSFYVLALFIWMASLSVRVFAVRHMEGCPGTGECLCHEVLGYGDEEIHGATGGTEDSEEKIHFPYCPKQGRCDCPLKKDAVRGPDGQYLQQMQIPISALSKENKQQEPAIEDRVFQALKLLLQVENPETFKTSGACELVSQNLVGKQLAPEKVNELLVDFLQSNGYQLINSFLNEKLSLDCKHDTTDTQSHHCPGSMKSAANVLRLKKLSPTRDREEYSVGSTVCIYFYSFQNNMYFFIDILESLTSKNGKCYAMTLPYSKEPLIFENWAKLNLFIDTYLVTFYASRLDLYLFKQPATP